MRVQVGPALRTSVTVHSCAPGSWKLPRFTQKRVSAFMIMDSLIAATAQYLPFLILVAAAVIWLFLPRPDKVGSPCRRSSRWSLWSC